MRPRVFGRSVTPTGLVRTSVPIIARCARPWPALLYQSVFDAAQTLAVSSSYSRRDHRFRPSKHTRHPSSRSPFAAAPVVNARRTLRWREPGWHSRYALPPVPTWHRADWHVLKDVPDVLGVALWRAVRDVRLWAETPADERQRLARKAPEVARERLQFAHAQAPELDQALAFLTELFEKPALVTAEEVAEACAHVADWAERQGATETAVQFAEAAAVADVLNPIWRTLPAVFQKSSLTLVGPVCGMNAAPSSRWKPTTNADM
jgi:hypothetical protein